jgi:hypothetical protein
MTMMRRLHEKSGQFALVALTLAALTLGPAPAARADKYGQLTAEWWQWVYKQPVATNPLFDLTGDRAANGQENGSGPAGKYFFLAGVFNVSGIADRTITVPAGQALFFPVINTEWDNVGVAAKTYKVPQLRALAAGGIDAVLETHATLNGMPLQIVRITSPVFSYWLPPTDNIYEFFGVTNPDGSPVTGTIKPAYADGYWVEIPPLPRGGPYLLNFGGSAPGFTLDITYHITIQ